MFTYIIDETDLVSADTSTGRVLKKLPSLEVLALNTLPGKKQETINMDDRICLNDMSKIFQLSGVIQENVSIMFNICASPHIWELYNMAFWGY